MLYYDANQNAIEVIDTAGNTTTRDLSVDWFSATEPVAPDTGAPNVNAALVRKDGTPIPALVPGNMEVLCRVTDGSGNVIDALMHKFSYDNDEAPTYQFFVPANVQHSQVGYVVTGGVYRASVTGDNGVTSYRFVNLDELDTNYPIAKLELSDDGKSLIVSAEKLAAEEGELNQIVSVMLSGMELLPEGEKTYRFNTTVPALYGGTYQLVVTDEAGNESISAEVTVKSADVAVAEDAVTVQKVTESESPNGNGGTDYTSNQDGTVTVDMDKISGGAYDPDNSADAGTPQAKYEFALLTVTGDAVPAPDENTLWETNSSFNGLDAGTYALYIRDANAPDNMAGPTVLTVEYLRVIIQNVETGIAYPGKADGSITVTATGGIGALEYACCDAADMDASDLLWSESSTFESLPAGTYCIQVRDSANHDNLAAMEVEVPLHACGNGTLHQGNDADCATETDGKLDHYTCECGKKFYDIGCTNPVADDADLVIPWKHTDENRDGLCDDCQAELEDGSPETGEYVHAALWTMLMVVSTMAVVGLACFGKKEEKQNQ